MAKKVFSVFCLLLLCVALSIQTPLLVLERPRDCTKSGPNACGPKTVTMIRGETHIGLPAVCYAQVDPGPCGRDLIRVFYDSKTNRCKHFSFSGCGGNANRFVSVKNCYHICNPGYRTRLIAHDVIPTLSTPLLTNPLKRVVKLNVTSVQEISVQMK